VAAQGWNTRDLQFYYLLAQTSFEMVAPIGLGLFLDWYFGWRPWATVAGAALGLVGGIGHMVILINRHQDEASPPDSGAA
jgi:F0F1-type ATP synthase assembly protein I